MKKISGILMIVFMVLGLVFAIPSVLNSYSDIENPSSDNITNGQWSSLFETKFADILPPRDISLSLWGMAELFLFKEGRKGVLIGENGWLFTDEEFVADKNRNQIIDKNKKFILETADTLKTDNVELIIVLIPAKARIEQDNLGKHIYPSYNQSFYKDIIQFLSKNNIDAPALDAEFMGKEDVFFKTDTHWTPKGSLLTAQILSQYIEQTKLFQGTDDYVFTTPRSEKFDGDLTRYVPVEKFNAKHENQLFYRDISLKPSETETSNLEDNLFGDKIIPIALVGTSYSANPLWNFENHLKYHLKSDIHNAADQGLGPFATMKKYLSSNEFKNMPPQLVVWEIPERYISIPETR